MIATKACVQTRNVFVRGRTRWVVPCGHERWWLSGLLGFLLWWRRWVEMCLAHGRGVDDWMGIR